MAVLDPASVPTNQQPPPVAIEEFTIDNRPVSFHDYVRITPGQDSLQIHYAGLSLTQPETVRFRYKLSGIDNEWIEAGSRRTAYYSHLPPGEYQFTVLAANRDGVWNTIGAGLRIVVVPPFWRTRWFLAISIFALAAFSLFLYKKRIRTLQREQAVSEEFSRRLIDTQENDRKRIAAELHNSLSQSLIVMKNWALLCITTVPENETAKKRLTEISSTASQALNEVREIAYNLSPYQIDRLGLSQTILEMIEKVADSSGIKFSTDVEPIDGLMSKDAEISLYRMIQESINNIIKHSGASDASLKIKPGADFLSVVISDNGRGFNTAISDDSITHKRGFGLFGICERARMLGGSCQIDSVPGSGTNISIRLPLGSQA